MNDDRPTTHDSPNYAPAIGFVLGAVVGAGLALLMAPASGEKTRRHLANTARRMGRDARETFENTREAASGLTADVKSAIDAGREAFRHGGDAEDGRPISRIAQTLTPPPTRTP
jgi:uncharacterized membrane protein YccC